VYISKAVQRTIDACSSTRTQPRHRRHENLEFGSSFDKPHREGAHVTWGGLQTTDCRSHCTATKSHPSRHAGAFPDQDI
jgi:hypothetical protein